MALGALWVPAAVPQAPGRVSLLGTGPPIWRRLLVAASLTPRHEFRIGQKRFGEPDPQAKFMGLPGICAESTARLANLLGKAGAMALYTYDFGDSWEHEVVVEEVLAPVAGRAYPICVEGER